MIFNSHLVLTVFCLFFKEIAACFCCVWERSVCVYGTGGNTVPLSLAVCWFYVACMSGQCVKLGRMEYECAPVMSVCTLVMLHCFTIPWCSFKCDHWALWSAITEQCVCLHSPSLNLRREDLNFYVCSIPLRFDSCCPFKAWSRSGYSYACFTHCQEFHACPNFFLP